MPSFGAHLSVAGGLHHAVTAAVELRMETVQIFTHSPSQWIVKHDGTTWRGREIAEAEVNDFRSAVAGAGFGITVAHDSYLINLAAPGSELWEKSIAAFANEIHRAEQLGLTYLVTHPGAHVGSGEEAGLARVTAGLNRVLAATQGVNVQVLLETTAGQGTCLGAKFEHLAQLLNTSADSARLGVCVDTCHIFAAGYPLGNRTYYDDTMQHLDDVVGLARVKLFHVNDSLKPLGSRVDRHAGIGRGEIGGEAFQLLVTDPRFTALPMILETPKEDANGKPMDAVNLRMLRKYHKAGRG